MDGKRNSRGVVFGFGCCGGMSGSGTKTFRTRVGVMDRLNAFSGDDSVECQPWSFSAQPWFGGEVFVC